ncbi:YfbU family protein [Duganella fentianensis]|uniref:YfbU family protein n=1 Tax=Duganella fentianensis TaxID=2692177 RepID=UPI0032B261D1
MDIKLTDAERLILANQYQILERLEGDESYGRLAKNLRDGHEFLYREVLSWISPEMDKATTRFVLDALSLYQTLHSSWLRLGSPAEIKESDVQWPGFDGNNEGALYGFTSALAADRRYVEQLGEHGVNSHSEMESTYRKMIGKWKELGEPRSPLTIEQISEIIAARGY